MAATVQDSSFEIVALAGGVVRFGVGCCFQNIIIAVQNAFPHSGVGVATAGSSMFRQVGGMFGTALVGAMFVGGLATNLLARLPAEAFDAVGASPSPELIGDLPAGLAAVVIGSYNDAVQPIYMVMTVAALLATVILCFIRPRPLADTVVG